MDVFGKGVVKVETNPEEVEVAAGPADAMDGRRQKLATETFTKLDKDGNPYPTREQCYITVTKTANSNQEHTNLILKKVILPGMGMDAATQTSPEQIDVLWDEFRCHSSKVVK